MRACASVCMCGGVGCVCLSMRGGFGLCVVGMGINWGQQVWIVGVCVCVCVCVCVFIFRELESSQTGFRKSEKNMKKRTR